MEMQDKLYQNISNTLLKYCDILNQSILEDFKSGIHTQIQYKKEKSSKKRIKFKFKLKNSSKKTVQFDPSQLRISSRICIKMINMKSIVTYFQKLKQANFDSLYLQDAPSLGSLNRLSTFHDKPVFFKIKIVKAIEIQLSRPWMTRVSIRVTDALGKVIGNTKPLPQSVEISFDHEMIGIAKSLDSAIKLNFDIIHHVPEAKKEYHFALGTSEFKLKESEKAVKIGNYCKLLVETDVVEFFTKDHCLYSIQQTTAHSLNSAASKLVDQVCYDFKEKFKKSMFSKTQSLLNNMMNNLKLKSSNTSSNTSAISEEELESDFAPLLEYLNTNFEVLTDVLEESFAFSIILEIWKRIIMDLETLLVPDLYSDVIDKPLDERSVSVLQYALMVRHKVFHFIHFVDFGNLLSW